MKYAYRDEDVAHAARREWINLRRSVSLIAQAPSGFYVFDVLD